MMTSGSQAVNSAHSSPLESVAVYESRDWNRAVCEQFQFDPDVPLCCYLDFPFIGPDGFFLINDVLQATQGYQFTVRQEEKEKQFSLFRLLRPLQYHSEKVVVTKAIGVLSLPNTLPKLFVIGFKDDIAVVQLTEEKKTRVTFLVVDVKSGIVTSSYTTVSKAKTHAREACISPDKSHFLLRHTDPRSRREVLLIRIGEKTCTLKYSFKDQMRNVCVTFDPRYGWTRIARTEFPDRNDIVTFSLKTECILQRKHNTIGEFSRIRFTQSGTFLVSVNCQKPPLNCQTFDSAGRHICIWDPDDLTLIHHITFGSEWKVRKYGWELHLRLSPMFSDTEQHMAVFSFDRTRISVHTL